MIQNLLKFKIIILFFIIFEIFVSLSISSHIKDDINVFIEYKTSASWLEYQSIYSKLKEQSLMIFEGEINRPDVINLFKDAYESNTTEQMLIRQKLHNHLTLRYERLSLLINLKQLHFHLPDNRSFLRMHHSHKFDDTLVNIRPTVEFVNKYHIPIDGFEEGRVHYGFRFVYPLFDGDKKYIGSVEVSFPSKAFQDTFNKNHYASQFLMAKDIVLKKIWKEELLANYEESSIHPNFYKENIDTDSNLKEFISKDIQAGFAKNIHTQEAFSLVHSLENTSLIFSFLPMKNPVNNTLIGYIIIISKDNTINSILMEERIEQFIGFFVVLAFFMFMYRRKINQEILVKSEVKYRTLIENIGHSYFFYRHDTQGVFLYTSDSLKNVLGYSKEEFLVHYNNYLTDNIINKDVDKYTKLSLQGFIQPSYKVEIYHKNGSKVWLEITESPQYNNNGVVIAIDGIAKDITNEIRVDKLIASSQTVLFYWHAKEQWPVAYVSENITIFGYSSNDFLSNKVKFYEIIHPDDLEQVSREVKYYSENHIDSFVQVYRIFDKDSSIRWIDDRTTIERNLDGEVIFYLGTIIDITEQKKTEEKLIYQTEHDELTNLPNRTLLMDRIKQSIKRLKYSNDKLAIIYLDFDRFKEINDSMGHNFGDKVIIKAGKRFSKCMRDIDTLARLGGDEFVILAENIQTNRDIISIIQKLREVINTPFVIEGQHIYITMSIGISLYPQDGNSAEILLQNADAAMFKAKDDGKNTHRFYTQEMTTNALEHIIMETNIRQGLKKEEFIVYYQPQVDSITNKLIGMEALVRWQHPTMGLISPFRFIPLAEKTGLILPLDRWVMKVAMKQIVAWYRQGLSPGTLALNISIQQLQKSNFISVLDSVMEEIGMKAEWLELEVTEGQIMDNPQKAIEILTQISQRGIKLAIDDFGTGYSSLAYLKQLPIDKLKIDKSFINDIPSSKDDKAITKSIISLSQILDLEIIAEGVETREQKNFLVSNGCKNIQGYLYGKPMEAKEIQRFWIEKKEA